MEFITPTQLSAQPNTNPASYRVENPSGLLLAYISEREGLVKELENSRPVVRNEEGVPVEGPATLHEYTGYIQAKNDILSFDLHRDSLTGALNREGFKTKLGRRLGLISRTNAEVPHVDLLLFMDTDRFKGVNDTHGHDAGDYVLQALASTLALEKTLRINPQEDRDPDTVARLGGDEFAALIQNVPEEKHELVVERIRKTLDSIEIPYLKEGKELKLEVGMSIGAFAIKHGSDIDMSTALGEADQEMYKEKRKRHPNPKNITEKIMNNFGWERKRRR